MPNGPAGHSGLQGIPGRTVPRVRELVLTTDAFHGARRIAQGALLCDMDLSILGRETRNSTSISAGSARSMPGCPNRSIGPGGHAILHGVSRTSSDLFHRLLSRPIRAARAARTCGAHWRNLRRDAPTADRPIGGTMLRYEVTLDVEPGARGRPSRRGCAATHIPEIGGDRMLSSHSFRSCLGDPVSNLLPRRTRRRISIGTSPSTPTGCAGSFAQRFPSAYHLPRDLGGARHLGVRRVSGMWAGLSWEHDASRHSPSVALLP